MGRHPHSAVAFATAATVVAGVASRPRGRENDGGWLENLQDSIEDILDGIGNTSREIQSGLFPHLVAKRTRGHASAASHLRSAFNDESEEMQKDPEETLADKEKAAFDGQACGSFPCCFTKKYDLMAMASTQAYRELVQADKAMGNTLHQELLDSAPAVQAGKDIDDALEIIKPLTRFRKEDEIDQEGPVVLPVVRTVQSSEQPDSVAFNKAHGRDDVEGAMPHPVVAALIASAPRAAELRRGAPASPRTQRRRGRQAAETALSSASPSELAVGARCEGSAEAAVLSVRSFL
eukprot:TRINITY_DN27698_c2_g1_i1.p1 TRINITY_DN27698_c2_g1~~TRINITY_DN27698_c2_g1_i1.p1  ORF type:complete len:292 (-),score=67.34 TRINITY_DN27698_c2_g1_i1:8-883(-)